MMRIRLMFALVLAFLIGNKAIAGPNDAINYLMDEPVSLFDLGKLKVDKMLETFSIEECNDGRVVGGMGYEWDSNRLTVGKMAWCSSFTKGTKLKDLCKKTIGRLRKTLGVDPQTGKPLLGEVSFFASNFSHFQYQTKSRPKDIEKTLDSMLTLSVGIFGSGPSVGWVQCEGPLIGTTVLFQE